MFEMAIKTHFPLPLSFLLSCSDFKESGNQHRLGSDIPRYSAQYNMSKRKMQKSIDKPYFLYEGYSTTLYLKNPSPYDHAGEKHKMLSPLSPRIWKRGPHAWKKRRGEEALEEEINLLPAERRKRKGKEGESPSLCVCVSPSFSFFPLRLQPCSRLAFSFEWGKNPFHAKGKEGKLREFQCPSSTLSHTRKEGGGGIRTHGLKWHSFSSSARLGRKLSTTPLLV